MTEWNQPKCEDCWWEENPGRAPTRIIGQYREVEVCSTCGKEHRSGIYVRQHPADVKYPAKEDE